MLNLPSKRVASSLWKIAKPTSFVRACTAAPPPAFPDPLPEPVPQGVPIKMTSSEAFVETLVAQGVTDVFGIVGSAFMDALDLFPEAGIRFLSVQHEQNAAHMADGYARASGKHGVCTAQNGPGITNFVTAIAAAYWAHSPVVCITPEAGTATKGLGGFQEADQLPIFSSITKYQGHVNNPNRMSEITARAFDIAMNERGPTQLNIPRDYFYHEADYVIPKPVRVEKSAGGPNSLAAAAELIREAKNPVILAGGGVVMGDAVNEVSLLADYLSAPVCTTYLHNDAFPANHGLWCGPLGYLGHQTAMKTINEADVVIALGTRLSPFGTLPQYGFDYWPKNAKIIQVEVDPRRIGLVKSVDVGINGDCKLATKDLLSRLRTMHDVTARSNAQERLTKLAQVREEWELKLDDMTESVERAREGKILPRQALRELERAMPSNAMVSTDIGNVCSVSNGYLRFNSSPSFFAAMTFGNCGYSFPSAMGAKIARPDRPAIAYVGEGAWGMSLNEVLTCIREKIPTTAIVFNNGQWGAEKKNQVLWFGDRYIGVQLYNPWSYADIARSMKAEGITCTHRDQIGDALRQAVRNQEEGKTTIVELMFTRELGDPFRRDAMKLPIRHLDKYKRTIQTMESSTGQPVDM
ncbi:sulfoacetaldehyde acetyltransferase-like [Rhopilema esculentum]|uniref:sulfoacetaldehyde acetyltransferase-like n=1 Tax=Rhopilema esculentum TaxID=499914 RepID=UPI0031D87FF7|eukprot:gene3632-14869_t